MEVNMIGNTEIKERLADTALSVLVQSNKITKDDFSNLGLQYGYLFTTNEGELEGLFRITYSGKAEYFATQKGKLMNVNISDEQFAGITAQMKSLHPCLNSISETNNQKKRREQNNKFLSKKNIAFSNSLISRWDEDKVTLKSHEEICKRAIACLILIQISCDIRKNNKEESLKFFMPMLEKFGVMDVLNSKEKRIIDGTYTEQDIIDMDWAYEAYWALCWSLKLVKDISDGGEICDCQKAIKFVINSDSLKDFMKLTKLRKTDEILDMLDLYYRYNWAINDSRINPNSSIGSLNPSIVIERRRALEWIVSDAGDWYDIEMNA